MPRALRTLQLRQMEEKLRPWRALSKSRPKRGWVRTIRESLGMTSAQLARRLGVTRQAVIDLERREADGSVTISALEKAAHAMCSEVVYAIVPQQELQIVIEQQAQKVAAAEMNKVAHSMRLESQGVSQDEQQRLIAESAANLLRTRPKSVWDSPVS